VWANLPFVEKIFSSTYGWRFESELETEFLPEDGKSFSSVARGSRQSLMLVNNQKIVI
jgi:hypothetical protein